MSYDVPLIYKTITLQIKWISVFGLIWANIVIQIIYLFSVQNIYIIKNNIKKKILWSTLSLRADSSKLNHSSPTLLTLGEGNLQPAGLYSVSESTIQWLGRWVQLGETESLHFIFTLCFNAGT